MVSGFSYEGFFKFSDISYLHSGSWNNGNINIYTGRYDYNNWNPLDKNLWNINKIIASIPKFEVIIIIKNIILITHILMELQLKNRLLKLIFQEKDMVLYLKLQVFPKILILVLKKSFYCACFW